MLVKALPTEASKADRLRARVESQDKRRRRIEPTVNIWSARDFLPESPLSVITLQQVDGIRAPLKDLLPITGSSTDQLTTMASIPGMANLVNFQLLHDLGPSSASPAEAVHNVRSAISMSTESIDHVRQYQDWPGGSRLPADHTVDSAVKVPSSFNMTRANGLALTHCLWLCAESADATWPAPSKLESRHPLLPPIEKAMSALYPLHANYVGLGKQWSRLSPMYAQHCDEATVTRMPL